MRNGAIFALSLLLGIPPSCVRAQGGSVAERYLFAQANAERMQRGLPQLRWDAALYRAASSHADEMARRASISHQYPGEPELATRGKMAGARFSMIAENVAEAPTAVYIHDAWMNSADHRANLLDAKVDAVAISVVLRDGQLFAVQDFERSFESLSLDEQEQRVTRLVDAVESLDVGPTDAARRTCSMESGYAGGRRPLFVIRYTASELDRLPELLREKLVGGRFRQVAVGACVSKGRHPFSSYSIAVMLYP